LKEKNDAQSLCFAAKLIWYVDMARLRRSAELGYAFAESLMAERTSRPERFGWALRAALQGERDGFHWLGRCFSDGQGCKGDKEKAMENFLKAANLK